MGAAQQALSGYGSVVAGITYATWNPADKAASITLSGGNLAATMTTAVGQVRSTIGKSSGKWYWEYVITGSVTGPLAGIATSAASLAAFTGQEASSYGYSPNGNRYNNNSAAAYGSAIALGDTVGVALDMTAGTLTWIVNNVAQGVAFSSLTGTFYAACSSSGGAACGFTANFGAIALTYTPPTGFNAGLYN